MVISARSAGDEGRLCSCEASRYREQEPRARSAADSRRTRPDHGIFGERLKRRPSSIPMQKVIGFAIFSTRRLEEITRISWKDLDAEGSRVLVRDMKNPGEKIGNNVWCYLPPEALEIICSMPKRHEEIFPHCGDT